LGDGVTIGAPLRDGTIDGSEDTEDGARIYHAGKLGTQKKTNDAKRAENRRKARGGSNSEQLPEHQNACRTWRKCADL
jgi:hypothetical protein